MVERITNITNKQNLPHSVDSRPVNIEPIPKGNLERSPQTDNVSLSGKKPMSESKALLTLGGIAAAMIGVAFAAKCRSSQITKALDEIESRFLKLQENLPQVQKTFKEVFLRDDITEKEALEILNRYKEVEKIGVTGTKEEYMQAMFREAKNNYGLSSLPSELNIVDKPIRGDERILGNTNPVGEVYIRSTIEHGSIADTIHHELRHLKQRLFAFNLAPDEYVMHNQPRNMNIPKEVFEYAFGGEASVANIPPKYFDFAKKSCKAVISYCSVNKNEAGYLAQWVEQDAYNAGRQMAKLLNGNL